MKTAKTLRTSLCNYLTITLRSCLSPNLVCKVTKKHVMQKFFDEQRAKALSNLKSTLTVKEWQRLSTNLTQVSQGARLRDIPKQPSIKGTKYFLKRRRKENGIQSSNKQIF